MTTMLLVVVMINPIPMSPFLSSQVTSPRLCRPGGASFLLTGFVYPKAHILEEGQVFTASCLLNQGRLNHWELKHPCSQAGSDQHEAVASLLSDHYDYVS